MDLLLNIGSSQRRLSILHDGHMMDFMDTDIILKLHSHIKRCDNECGLASLAFYDTGTCRVQARGLSSISWSFLELDIQ